MANVSGSFFSTKGRTLELDSSDLQNKINMMRGTLTRTNFERLIYRTFREVGSKAKTIVKKETSKDYAPTQAWIGEGVQKYRVTTGGTFVPVKCEIPLKAVKGVIGGPFKAYKLTRGKISANILRHGRSRLPEKMENQGGNPPFIVENVHANGKQGMEGKAFTRRTKKRLPVVRVVAMASPQFPLNRSEDKTMDALMKKALDRLEHNFEHMFGLGKNG